MYIYISHKDPYKREENKRTREGTKTEEGIDGEGRRGRMGGHYFLTCWIAVATQETISTWFLASSRRKG